MISANLPALQVVIPLLAAPLAFLLRKPRLVWSFAMLVTLLTFLVSIGLLQQVLDHGVISYAMGGWSPPWGIEYRVDEANAYIALIVSAMGTIVMAYAGTSVRRELPEHKQPLFHVAYLLCLAGLLGIVTTGDAFNVFVFLEVSSLSTYILMSLGSDRRALTATFQYLIMGTLGATFILIGVGLMYVMTGTLNMVDLAQRLPEVANTRTIYTAFAFVTVGVSLKLALFPLHGWLPNAYTYAPSAATAFVASTATKVAIYVLLRFTLTIFGVTFSFNTMPLSQILLALAVLAVLIPSTVAIYQQNIKRMFAYSSVAQVGYIILGISFGTVLGVSAGLLHIFNHALMKGGIFLALGCLFYRTGSVQLDTFRGLGKTMPWTMAAIVIGGLSIVGVPLTSGFISKWYLVLAALEEGYWPIAAVVLVGSLLAAIYLWKLVEMAYFQQPDSSAAELKEAPLALLLPTWLVIGASIYFGINTDLTVGVATLAAETLIEGVR